MSVMKILQQSGFSIAIILIIIGYIAWKNEYKIFAIVMYILAFVFFILIVIGFTAYVCP